MKKQMLVSEAKNAHVMTGIIDQQTIISRVVEQSRHARTFWPL